MGPPRVNITDPMRKVNSATIKGYKLLVRFYLERKINEKGGNDE